MINLNRFLARRPIHFAKNTTMVDPSEKSVKTAISAPETLLMQGKRKADAEYGGNFSAYIQNLIELDLSGKLAISKNDTQVLELLYSEFVPAYQSKIETWIIEHKLDQRLLLTDLLIDLATAIKQGAIPESITLRQSVD